MKYVVQFTALMPIVYKRSKGRVVASCPPLDLHSQGRIKKEAKDNLEEALSLFFLSCFERGTLEDVLKQCGFTPSRKIVRKKVVESSAQFNPPNFIKVPIPFEVNADKALCPA